LLPATARTFPLPEALRLCGHAQHGDALDFDFEQQLDGPADVCLGGVAADFENNLVAAFGERSRFLGYVRTEQHLHQSFAIGSVAHLSRSSTLFSAAAVMMTLSAPTRLTGSISCASRTLIPGMLRAASQRFMSNASTMMRPFANSSFASFSRSSFVFGAVTPNSGVTTRRSWRNSSDHTARMAARYTSRLTFCSQRRGPAAKILPPPPPIGLRIEPARAR